jgi:NADPH:quinone reductase-like Zn-dependent oxidoreductase
MSAFSLPVTFTSQAVDPVGTPMSAKSTTVSSLADDHVLVRIRYASINPMDGKLARNNFWKLPEPLVLGFDFSGVVAAVGGSGGGELQVGDEVFGFNDKGACYAQYVAVKKDRVVKRGAIPLREAATYGIAYSSAYEPLLMADDIRKRSGQTIYIAGGGGGVGHFAVQLAKLHGLRVISSGSKPASLDLLRSLKVDHVIDYSKQDVVAEVLKLTGGKGADIVYDPTYSPASFKQSASLVASGGRWLRLGGLNPAEDTDAQRIAKERGAEATYGDFGRYWFQPQYISRVSEFAAVLKEATSLYEQGKVRPHIAAEVPFTSEALQRAVDDNNSGKANVGKVVVKVA